MSRPLRIEFAGAVYHVTARGDRREQIFDDDEDRQSFLTVLGEALARFDAQCLAYCLMGNHYHLVLYTRAANLSRLMRQLNGVYTQRYNRRHGLVGHLLQGRFKAILVDRDSYLLALCRYVERNPVAAHLAVQPQDWPWSSCRAHLLMGPTPPWLDSDGLLSFVLGRELLGPQDRQQAALAYADLVDQPLAESPWGAGLRQQIYLGSADFVARMQAQVEPAKLKQTELHKLQRAAPLQSLSAWLAHSASREQAFCCAYRQGGMTMTRIAREAGLSVTQVSRLIKRGEMTVEEEGKWKT